MNAHPDTWTDEEWLSVIGNVDPHADVTAGIEHVDQLRSADRDEQEP